MSCFQELISHTPGPAIPPPGHAVVSLPDAAGKMVRLGTTRGSRIALQEQALHTGKGEERDTEWTCGPGENFPLAGTSGYADPDPEAPAGAFTERTAGEFVRSAVPGHGSDSRFCRNDLFYVATPASENQRNQPDVPGCRLDLENIGNGDEQGNS